MGQEDILVLEVSKSKDSRPFEPRYLRQVEIPLGTDTEGLPVSSLVLVPAERVARQAGDKLSNNQIKILKLLSDPLHDDGLILGEIVELTNIPKTTAYNALSALFKMEYITRAKNKAYIISEEGKTHVK